VRARWQELNLPDDPPTLANLEEPDAALPLRPETAPPGVDGGAASGTFVM
jgi:hypothetical protein